MAKGSPFGIWRGKLGSNVFYKNTNSNDANKQGIRQRVYTIKNPQTAAQIDQRMKQVPAQRIAGALSEVIKRSFQGVEYGAKSRQEFLKYALSMKIGEGWPYVDRDETRPVPGKYLISRGTLNGFGFTYIRAAGSSALTNIKVTGSEGIDTVGQISTDILDNNPTLNEGDQLTFVVCKSKTDIAEEVIGDTRFIWHVASFYLDTTDDTDIKEFLTQLGAATVEGLAINAGYLDINFEDDFPCAGAIIVSRLSGTSTYQRSTASITIDETLMAPWMTNQRHDLAKTTYIKTASRSTNWPVDTETRGGTSRERVDGTYTLTGLTGNAASLNGTAVRVMRYVDDNSLAAVYVKTSETYGYKCPVNTNNVIVSYPGAGDPPQDVALDVLDVPALANLPQVAL